jgi:hypothetical protein
MAQALPIPFFARQWRRLMKLFRRNPRGARPAGGSSRPSRGRWVIPSLEYLEDRVLLNVTAALNQGILNVQLDASNDAATITADGTNIQVSNGTSTILSQPVGNLTGISVSGTGNSLVSAGQGVTLNNTGKASLVLSGGLQASGLATATVEGSWTASSVDVSADTITVTAGATLSTRQTAGTDPAADNIAFSGKSIALQSGAGLFSAGDIRLTTQGYTIVRTADQPPPAATIKLDHATLQGNEVALTAASQEHLGVFGFVKDADAAIDIGDSTIQAGNVDLKALADTRLIPDVTSATMSGNPQLTFTPANGDRPATITRNDTTDPTDQTVGWLADRFVPGQSITVTGTQNNDGSYGVAAVTATTLTLKPGDDLAAESITDPAKEGVSINGTLVTPDPETVFDTLFKRFRGSAITTLSTATSEVRVTGASSITSTGKVTITSTSQSRATPYFPGLAIPKAVSGGGVWAESTASAQTSVEDTSTVTAGTDFDLNAITTNNTDAVAQASAVNTPVNLVFAGADTTSKTNSFVAPGATVHAGSANVESDSENDVSVGSTVADQGGSGAGLAVATSLLENDNSATVAGKVTTTSGDVTVLALANTLNNIAETDARDLGSTNELQTQVSNSYNQFFRDAAAPLASSGVGSVGSLNPSKFLIEKLFPVVQSGKLNLSGAVTVLESTNNVTAFIDRSAQVNSAGNVTVQALLTDRTNTSAVAEANSDKAAAGGAVVYASYTNHVDAFIGPQATVNAAQDVTVNAQLVLPYPWQINFNSLDLLVSYLGSGNLRNLVLTSYARNASTGDKFGGGGAVNIQLFDNEAHAYVGAGAQVNAGGAVNVQANSSVNTLNVVGAESQWSLLTQLATNQASQRLDGLTRLMAGALPQSLQDRLKLNKLDDPKVGLGGSLSYFVYTDSAIADIEAGATVAAAGQVSVTSNSQERIIGVSEARGTAQKLAVFGAGSALTLNNTTLAFIDDQAHVSSGAQLHLQATNDPRAYNFAGGVASGAAVGIGLSASVAQVNSTVKSFIGPQTALSGNPSLTFQGVALTTSPTLTFNHATSAPPLTFAHVGLTGSPSLTFTPNSSGGDTIQRSSGSWTADGFQVGQSITVSGAAADDGVYQIAAISDDGSTLTLTQSGGLTQETDPGGTLTGNPTLTFQPLNYQQVALSGNPTLTFTDNASGGDTIVRSSGSWAADGFQAGQTISVSGSAHNNGSYQIASVSPDGGTLTLTLNGVLTDETAGGAGVSAPDVPATITRDSGNWGSDGFQAGQSITVTGSADNDGTYLVAAVSPDGKTLTLAQGEVVNAETDAGGVQVVTGPVDVTAQDTIRRTDGGNFSTDGFRVGQPVTVTGSSNNNGTYQIAAISADGSTLTLSQGDELTSETDAAGVVTLTGPDTLSRNDTANGGSWVQDGFQPGQVIAVSGTASNNGTYTVGSVSDGVLTLQATPGDLIGNPTLTFAPAAGGDTITRSDIASGGSWYADGFQAGQSITVTGSTSNDGSYQIAAISPDGSTLALTQSGVFKNEADSGVAVTANTPVQFHDETVAGASVRGQDTVTRDGGSWIADGFVRGQTIAVKGSGANDGTYEVAQVTDGALTLTTRGQLTNETQSGVAVTDEPGPSPTPTVRAENGPLTFTHVAATGNPGLTFTHIALTGNPTLTFTPKTSGAETIFRSSGSWSQDGFQAGETITVSGTVVNDGTYLVTSVAPGGRTLVLSRGSGLTGQTTGSGSLTGTPTLTFAHTGLTDNPTLTFTHNAGGGDTVRRSSGSWTSDGFQAGESITVAGTGLTNNDASFTIASISADGSTLILSAGDLLTDETVTGGVTIIAPDVPDTITRDSGSWAADGFQVGQPFTVSGSARNDGTFQIGAISPDGKVLTLVPGEVLNNEVASDVAVQCSVRVSAQDTITRSSGSWVADGFQVGQAITVLGSARNDGAHRIAAISPDGRTLILAPGDSLADETNTSGVSIGGPDMLQRNDGGSWVNDGFLQGQIVTISGTAQNDGTYVLGAVTPGLLTLQPTLDVLTDNPTLTFTSGANGNTITRSQGNWIADGFHAGQSIAVSGSSNNGVYTIAAVTAGTLTLAQSGALTNGTDSNGAMTGSPGLIFHHNSNGQGDTITRRGGSWVKDGFQVGQTITVTNSLSNDGSYQIAAISSDGHTLTLVPGDRLTNENEQNNNLPFIGGAVFSISVLGGIASNLPQVTQPITITSATTVSAPLQFHDETTSGSVVLTTSPIAAVVGISTAAASGNQVYSFGLAGSKATARDEGKPDASAEGSGARGAAGAAAGDAGGGAAGGEPGGSGGGAAGGQPGGAGGGDSGGGASGGEPGGAGGGSGGGAAGGEPGSAPGGATGAAAAESGKGKFGLGASASVSVNQVSASTRAYVSGAAVSSNSLTVQAQTSGDPDGSDSDRKTQIIAATGSLVLNTNTRSAALAGAFSQNTLTGDTSAYVDNSQVALTADLDLAANSDDHIIAVGASGTGSGKVGIAGQVMRNIIGNATDAQLSGDTAATDGPVTLTATDGPTINADAGGVAFAISRANSEGSGVALAVGGSAAVNEIGDTARANIDGSSGGGSVVDLGATSTASIQALTIGGAVSASNNQGAVFTAALAGAGSGNTIRDTTAATITGGSRVAARSGPVTLTAADSSTILGDAGGVALALALGDGSNAGLSIGAAFVSNDIANTVEANIDGSAVTGVGVGSVPGVELTATSTASIQALTIAGAGSAATGNNGLAISGAGAGSYNTVGNTVSATVTGGALADGGSGSVILTADDQSTITADAGGISVGLAISKNTNAAITVGAAAAVNTVANTVQATIDGSRVTAGLEVTLRTTSEAKIEALTFGIAGSLASGQGVGVSLAGAGSGSDNTITDTTEATVTGASTVTSAQGSAVLEALDTALIVAAAGAAALTFARGQSTSVAASVAVSVAVNEIHDRTRAAIDGRATGLLVTTDGVDLLATSTATIEALTFAGSGGVASGDTGLAFAGAGAGSGNTIANTVEAVITSGFVNAVGGAVTLSATDSPTIETIAGGVAVGVAASQSLAGSISVGAAAAFNTITDTVTASISNSTVSAPGVALTATTANATIEALTVGVAGSIAAGGEGPGAAFAGAGSASDNTIGNTVQATISGSSTVSTNLGAVALTATDQATIKAAAGAAAFAVAGGEGGGAAVPIAASAAVNRITDTAAAVIDGSNGTGLTVTAAGIDPATGAGVELTAAVTATIEALSVAGSVGVAGGEGGGLAVTGAGAGTSNTIQNTVAAAVRGGSQVSATSGGVALTATDSAQIRTDAGGVSLGLAGGEGGGADITVGAAAATNTITDTVTATIDASTVTGSAGVVLTATTLKAAIEALTFGVAGGLAGGEGGGVSLSGAGSGSGNTITNTVQAAITGHSTVAAIHGPVALTANDNAAISSKAGAAALALAGGGAGGVAASVGVSAAVNQITDTTRAAIDGTGTSGATVSASGADPATGAGVELTATSTATIQALTYAGTGAAAVGSGAVAASGAGAYSNNAISNTVEAAVRGRDTVSTAAGEAVLLAATDQPSIAARAGGAAVAVSVSAAGAAIAVGAAEAVNTIADTVTAAIDTATVAPGGGLTLSATSAGATIDAGTLGIAGGLSTGGGSLAGAGSGSTNTITDTVQAFIADGSRVSAGPGQPIALTATDGSAITANGGGFAVAASSGLAGAVGASVSTDTVSNTVRAYVDGAAVRADHADIALTAGETAAIAAQTLGGGAGGGAAAALSAGAADSTNTIANTVEADVQDGGSLTTTGGSGAVRLTASDTSAIDAEAAAGAGALAGGAALAVGGADATNDIGNTVEAYGEGATINSAGDVDLSATAHATITALSVAASVAAAPAGVSFSGAGAASDNTIHNTVASFLQGAGSSPPSKTTATGAVTLAAAETATTDAEVGSGALSGSAVSASAGLSVADNADSSTVRAYAQDANVNATTIGITAQAQDTIKNTDAVATSVAASAGVAGAQATATVRPSVEADAGTGTDLQARQDVTIQASSVGNAAVNTVGVSAGFVALGGTASTATDGSSVRAHVDGDVHGSTVTVAAQAMSTADASATALAGGVIAGAGAVATATTAPAISAYTGANSRLTATDGVSVSAAVTPRASAVVIGVAAGAVSLGAAQAQADDDPAVGVTVGDNTQVRAGSLTLSATQKPAHQNTPTAFASAGASSGGVLAGADATDATAAAGGQVTASTGTNVSLPDGDVTLVATSQTYQSALASGVAVGGVLAVGANNATATSAVTTQANLGDGARTSNNRSGALTVEADGTDLNVANSTAGSGGAIAGDASTGSTSDSSSVSAGLGSNDNLAAGSVTVQATHLSDYAPSASSVNAAVAGASGADASYTGATTVTVNLGTGTQITASGPVQLAAQNAFDEATQYDRSTNGASASAGAGGLINGSAALSQATVTGNDSVTLGQGVVVQSGTDPFSNPGGITITASSVLDTADVVTLTTGGAIEGAGVNSTLNATLNNTVEIGQNDQLTSQGNIGVGTYTTTQAGTDAEVSTYGLAAVGSASASTAVTTNQSVLVDRGATLKAFGNVNLTAGNDPGGTYDTPLSGSSSAQGYVRGLIAVPLATANTDLQSNASLTVAAGAQVESGLNTTIGAYPGQPSPTASGTGHGFEVGFVPVTQSNNTLASPTTSSVELDGTVTAGIYHSLTITIPDSRNVPDGTDVTKGFSSTIQSGPNGAPFSDSFTSNFNPPDVINRYFSGNDAMALESRMSSSPVGAFTLGPLYAVGGDVTVNAGTLQSKGGGAITAYGGPTITVTNDSPDYLVLSGATIPFLPGGNVVYTGAAGQAAAGRAGIGVTQVGAGAAPVVNVQERYNGAVGSSVYGPAVFLTGDVNNLGGQVAITNVSGSIAQAASINAAQVNLSAPDGVYVDHGTNGIAFEGADPLSEWGPYMIWPGGDPGTTKGGNFNFDQAVAYAANGVYNADGLHTTDQDFTQRLIGHAGDPANSISHVFFGNDAPWDSFLPHDGTQEKAQSLSLVGQAYAISGSSAQFDEGYFPVVPVEPLSKTASDYSQASTPAGKKSTLQAAQILIDADVIDLTSEVTVGQPTAWSVSLPATLRDQIAADSAMYAALGGSGLFDLTAPTVGPGDAPITAQFDAATGQILVNDVSASSGGGSLRLDGKIMNTNLNGKIHVNGGPGQVTIDNETGYPVVVNSVAAGSKGLTAAASGEVDIIDRNQSPGSEQTLYVYDPALGIAVYHGGAGASVQDLLQGAASSVLQGQSSTNYAPENGLRWQWHLQATLKRALFQGGSFNPGSWSFSAAQRESNANNPWEYIDDSTNNPTPLDQGQSSPTGRLAVQPGLPLFQETIVGSTWASYTDAVNYHDGHFGFAPTDPPYSDNIGQVDPWNYAFEDKVQLDLFDSVKADNPIGIDFTGLARGQVNITSDAPVVLAGNLINPDGDTTILAQGGITQTASATVSSNNLLLATSSGGVGSAAQPVTAALTAGGVLTVQSGNPGVYVNLDSGAVLGQVSAGDPVQGYGDVVINAAGNLDMTATSSHVTLAGAVNVSGDNITLNASAGEVGTADAPIHLIAHGTPLANGRTHGGVVNVTALSGIGLMEDSGDLEVGKIASTGGGNVTLSVLAGQLYDASGTTASETLSTAQIEHVWKNLGLTDSNASQSSVKAFNNEVGTEYGAYWKLLDNGSVANDVFTLNEQAVPLYRGPTAVSLGIADPSTVTDDQVQKYANDQYHKHVTFFNQNLDLDPNGKPIWATEPEFQKYDLHFRYDVSAHPNAGTKASDLTKNAVWTTGQLQDAINQLALHPVGGTPVGSGAPNLVGANISLYVGGQVGTPVSTVIPLADLQSGRLTRQQAALLAVATLPGSVLEQGTDAQGNVVTFAYGDQPAGVTLTGVVVADDAPLFVAGTGSVSASGQGPVYLQSSTPDLTVGQVLTGGPITLAAPRSILRTAGNSFIAGGGDVTLIAGSGTLGTASAPLKVETGGQLIASAAGDTSIEVTATAETNRAATRFAPLDVAHVISVSGNIALLVDTSDISLHQVRADAGTVTITAARGNIVNANTDGSTAVYGTSVTLSAAMGTIGTSTSPVTLDTSTSATGVVAASANGTINLDDVAGDLRLDQVTATQGDVTLTADGSIVDGDNDSRTKVQGANVRLESYNGGIGTATHDLVVASAHGAAGLLNAAATDGVYLTQNVGDLSVGHLASAAGDIRLTAPETAGKAPNLTLAGTSSIIAGGNVLLRPGGNVNLQSGSKIAAQGGSGGTPQGTIVIQGDYAVGTESGTDPATTFNLFAQMFGSSAGVRGRDDNDVFNVGTVTAGTPLNVVSGGANATFNVSSSAPAGGGNLDGIQAQLTLNASQGNKNQVTLNDQGSRTAKTVALSSGAIVGFAPAEIDYLDSGTPNPRDPGPRFNNVVLIAGNHQPDTFTVLGTTPGTPTKIEGGTVPETYTVGGPAPKTGDSLLAIRGPLTIAGGGSDTLTVDDSASTGPKSGTLTPTTLTGLDMTPGGITYSGLAALNVRLGSGGSTLASGPVGNTFTIQDIHATTVTSVDGGASNNDTVNASFAADFNGNLSLTGFEHGTVTVHRNFKGTLNASPGHLEQVQVVIGSITPSAALTVGGLDSLVVGPNHLSVGQNLAGTVNVTGTLGSVQVAGGTPGTITAGHVGTVEAYGGYGPVVLRIIENGVERRVEEATPTQPYPQPNAAALASGPYVNVQYVYESGTLANPQLTARISNNVGTAPDQYDLSLVTYSDTAKFSLARLDTAGAGGIAGIRDIAVEGDVLTSVSSQAMAFFTTPGPNGKSLVDMTAAGIRLPHDHLAGVAVRDVVPAASMQAASIQALAFGSRAGSNGQVVTGAASHAADAQALLVPGTGLVQAADTYRVPFADLATQQVQLFVVTVPGGGSFDPKGLVLTVQADTVANATGTGNVVVPSNAARGAVTALVRFVQTHTVLGKPLSSVVQSIDLHGDGASIQTLQSFAATAAITSTGPLGDLSLQEAQGLNSLTAPSIFGSILLTGPLTGILQTTGRRTDPITGAVSMVAADLGRLFVDTSGKSPVVSATTVQLAGLTGELISRGDLVSQVNVHGGTFTGTVAVQGSLGRQFTPQGTPRPVRLGGLTTNDPFGGQLVVLGVDLGDLSFGASLKGGRLAVKGGIAGNVAITGDVDPTGAVVADGPVGDPKLGTSLTLSGNNRGILAARGPITFGQPVHGGSVFNNVGATPGNANAAAIDAIFTDGGQPLALDRTGLDLGGLKLILQDLAALYVGPRGNLTGPRP